MKTFYDMLDELEDIGSHIDIENHLIYILTHVKNAEAFFRLTFNNTVYGLAEKSFYNAFGSDEQSSRSFLYGHVSKYLLDVCEGKSSQKIPDLEKFAFTVSTISGDNQLAHIYKFFIDLPGQKAKWFCRALLHDLRCGVQVKTINKAFKAVGLKQIQKFSMQLCAKNVDLYDPNNKQIKKITFPCSMECKEDGIRLQAEIWSDDLGTDCILTSRRGTDRTELHPEIVKDLCTTFAGENLILDGEVIASSFNSLTRKDDVSKRVYVVFDILNDEMLPYCSRWNNLINLFSKYGITEYKDNKFINIKDNHIKLVEHYTASNIRDLQEYYEALNERKEEGLIIKLEDRPYERGSRKNMFKVKKVFDADLKCIGFNYGEGKRAGMVGSLKLIDNSGIVKVDVGSGLSDYDVTKLTEDLLNLKSISKTKTFEDSLKVEENPNPVFIGKIVEIQYNELSQDKDGNMSIRGPRFIRMRNDKEEADDLSEEELRK